MLPTLSALFVMQASPQAPGGVAYELTAAKAISTYELTSWRKIHPKADLSLTFSNSQVTPSQTNLVRTRLGLKNTVPVLDSSVLTMVFDSLTQPGRKRLSMEAYVFQGSFPKGFHARYLIQTDGKEPKVLSRTILQRYDVGPDGPPPRKASIT